jgi:hypothetical protein
MAEPRHGTYHEEPATPSQREIPLDANLRQQQFCDMSKERPTGSKEPAENRGDKEAEDDSEPLLTPEEVRELHEAISRLGGATRGKPKAIEPNCSGGM